MIYFTWVKQISEVSRLDAAVKFPELRGLMAKHGMNHEKMAILISTTSRTFGNKINGYNEFTFDEMAQIKKFFESRGETISIDDLFFAWAFTEVK